MLLYSHEGKVIVCFLELNFLVLTYSIIEIGNIIRLDMHYFTFYLTHMPYCPTTFQNLYRNAIHEYFVKHV